jgi:ribosomal protein L40E
MLYLISGVLTGGVLAAVCWPLFSRGDSAASAILEETEWDLLQRKKEVILGNIQDLDFEHTCGKLSDGDHQRVRRELAGEAASVFQSIDEIEHSQDLDALIRREVASRKQRVADSGVCAHCGQPNPPRNKYCAECGSSLAR